MTTYFADTYFFIALLNPRDEHHQEVSAFTQGRSDRLVTTHWVLVEVADALAASPFRERAAALFDDLERDPSVLVLVANDQTLRQGLNLYRNRNDKSWSLTDCISFEVMQDGGMADALTGDHHFEQAGFTAVFRQGSQ